ncbi:hypothetical protein Tco_1055067 [Tanacetum coccineum]|uniref:Uncharacterized protein n=1 Tax=Tanacetum coccineum TaxID=301880 RepID=A0ABQ5GZC6_9ASTR
MKITVVTLVEEQMSPWKAYNEVMEVLVRCWSDGDMVLTSVLVKWFPFTKCDSDEAQTSEHGGDVFDLIGDVDPTDEDGDIGMGDSTGVLTSLSGEIFSRGKKCREIKH